MRHLVPQTDAPTWLGFAGRLDGSMAWQLLRSRVLGRVRSFVVGVQERRLVVVVIVVVEVAVVCNERVRERCCETLFECVPVGVLQRAFVGHVRSWWCRVLGISVQRGRHVGGWWSGLFATF